MSNGHTFNHALSLCLAQECMKCVTSEGCANAANDAIKEAAYRCVINRAYYSVWPRAKRFVEAKEHIHDQDRDKIDAIAKLIKQYRNAGPHFATWAKWVVYRNIDTKKANHIFELVRWRNIVDYDKERIKVTFSQAEQMLLQASIISELLNA